MLIWDQIELMSNSKLKKYIEKNSNLAGPDFSLVPVCITDSKGKYIQRTKTESVVQNRIIWHCKAGLNSSTAEKWLKANISELRKRHGSFQLYIWLGTCDLTSKEGRYISLKPNSEEALEVLQNNYRKIKVLCQTNSVKVLFLQIPYYSIQIWNERKGHSQPDTFKPDDCTLTSLIDRANSFINDLNTQMSMCSPKFCQDMVRSRKAKNSAGRYSINFNLLRDGIHPGALLAKVWCISIVRRLCKDCA